MYASTILKFIDDSYLTEKQLEIVCDGNRNQDTLCPLDKPYTQILSTHKDPEILIDVLGYLVLFSPTPAHKISISLGLDHRYVDSALQTIQCLLSDRSRDMLFVHTSFQDYLDDEKRSGLPQYFIDRPVYMLKLVCRTLSAISSTIVKRFQRDQSSAVDDKNLDIHLDNSHKLVLDFSIALTPRACCIPANPLDRVFLILISVASLLLCHIILFRTLHYTSLLLLSPFI